MDFTHTPRKSDVLYVYNERTGEYRSLDAGWNSFEAAIEHAIEEGTIESTDDEFRVGIEIGAR